MSFRKAVALFALTIAFVSLVGLLHPAATQGWSVSPGFHKKSGEDISGALCPTGNPDWCYAVNDEKKYIQLFQIRGNVIVPGDRLRLIDKKVDGVEMDELDAEGIAYEDGFVYVIGSHGLTRTTGEFQPSRYFLSRLPVDAQTGEPAFTVSEEDTPPEVERSAVLSDVMSDHGILGPHFRRPLDENGINIEGLAVAGGRAVVGLRQPSLGDGVLVFSVGIDCLFAGAPCAPVLTHLPVGRSNAGVRDIVADGERFLLLVAAALGDEAPTGAVWSWRGGPDAPEHVADIDLPGGEKPETLMFLPGDPVAGSRRALILFDGEADGAPREIALPLPPG